MKELVLHREIERTFVIEGHVENSLPHEYGRYYWIRKQRMNGSSLMETKKILGDGKKLYRKDPTGVLSKETVTSREDFWSSNVTQGDNPYYRNEVPKTPEKQKVIVYREKFGEWTTRVQITSTTLTSTNNNHK